MYFAKSPIRPFSLLILASSVTAPLNAQEWKAELAKELVTVRDGKLVAEGYDLMKIELAGYQPVQIQIKSYAEAPAMGLMSRDTFVALTTQLFIMTFLAAYADAYGVPAAQFLEAVDFTELSAPIGTPDVEIESLNDG